MTTTKENKTTTTIHDCDKKRFEKLKVLRSRKKHPGDDQSRITIDDQRVEMKAKVQGLYRAVQTDMAEVDTKVAPKYLSINPGTRELRDLQNLHLDEKTCEKILIMLDEYPKSVAAAEDIDGSLRILPLDKIWPKILELGPEMLKEIANLEKPTLLITPNNSFDAKIRAMNYHKYFTGEYLPTNMCGLQLDASIETDDKHDSWCNPYGGEILTPRKNLISIVEGTEHPSTSLGLKLKVGSRDIEMSESYGAGAGENAAIQYLRGKGMELINIHEMAVLMQLSLREYKQAGNDVNKIVDFIFRKWETPKSFINRCHFTRGHDFVAYCCFWYGRVAFRMRGRRDGGVRDLGVRASVKVMEY